MKKLPFKLTDLINCGSEFLDGVFNSVTNGITITDENSVILYVNSAFTKITGYARSEALGKNPGILHSGRHGKSYYKNMWEIIHKKGYWSGEIWSRHKSGYLLPEWINITKLSATNKTYYIAVFSDITTLVEKNKEKLNLAYSDPLTGLYNRHYLKEVFTLYERHLEKRAKIKSKNMALFFIDVNKFKLINDEHGHLAGDHVLRHIADILKISIRKEDIAIRYGGDEFIVILNNVVSRDIINKTCERISMELSHPFTYENNRMQVSISIGVALYPLDANNLSELISIADKAMYESKINNKFLTFVS